MALTNEQLERRIIEETSKIHEDFNALTARLDAWEINGAVQYLREFGYWLRENPEAFTRMRRIQTRREEREIAVKYVKDAVHWDVLASKAKWAIGGMAAGLLFATGAGLVSSLHAVNLWHILRNILP